MGTKHSTVTALHTVNNSIAKGFNQMAPPVRTITLSTRYELLQTQSLGSLQTTPRDAKPTQHIEITHPDNVNLKLVSHNVASFYPHYLTYTPQTYHHPVHRFRSWPMQTTSPSHPHKHECSQEIHTTIPT